MYGPFYQPSPFFQPPDNQSTKAPQPGPAAASLELNKSKDQSPLDLMNKLQPSSKSDPSGSSVGPASSPVGPKLMQHYPHYPYK